METGDVFCPRCRTRRCKSQELKGISVDVCTSCSGVWFDGGELERVTDVAAKDLKMPLSARSGDLACPRCRRPLYAFQYPETLVVISFCRKCRGLWLDPGELEEIVAVRRHLRKTGELDTAGGVKGGLLKLVNGAIEALMRD